MLAFDIVLAFHPSPEEIGECAASILKSDYDLKKVYLHSRASGAEFNAQYGAVFGGVDVGNAQPDRGKAPYILFLNAEARVYPDTLNMLSRRIEQDRNTDIALWELRQMPHEQPRNYDILTGEISFCSGMAFAVRRDVYEEIGGSDESCFTCCGQVDLSWRVRAEGYRLCYVPKAAVWCETPDSRTEERITGNLLLRRKFGSWKTVLAGNVLFLPALLKKPLRQACKKARPALKNARTWHRENKEKLIGRQFSFYGCNYDLLRVNDRVRNERTDGSKKVSVILRTCGRPAVLRETLISLRHQTYPNVEIVIVEDGENISEAMIGREFSDLNILYAATGKKRGRCYNGNLAMQMATGDYLNFLDDDDLFFADHIETLADALQRHPEYKIAYSTAFETPITVHSREPYRYTVQDITTRFAEGFDLQRLLSHNIAPIQAVMFEKSVFEECGGLDETLDVLEDWDLWIRYALRYPFLYVPKTTSLYRVPADRKTSRKRLRGLEDTVELVQARYGGHIAENGVSLRDRLTKALKGKNGISRMAFFCIHGAYSTVKGIKKYLLKQTGRTI